MAMTEDMVRALYAPQVEPMALLLTITAAGLDAPLYVTDYPDGVTSQGFDFTFFPFALEWNGAGQQEPVRQVQLTIGNSDNTLLSAIRIATDQPLVTVQMVRVAAPDAVERAMTNCRIISAEDEDPKVTFTLQPRQFDTEPACQAYYTIARTPSLF